MIINNDFLSEEVNIKDVDLVITEPPHGIVSYRGNVIGEMDRFRSKQDIRPFDDNLMDMDKVLTKIYDSMKDGATLIMFWDVWLIGEIRPIMDKIGFDGFRIVCGEIENPVPLNCELNYLSKVRNYAVLATKGSKKTFNAKYHNGVIPYTASRKNSKSHVFELNIDLLKTLILHNSNENDIVFDPFMGCGSTLLAAQQLNREYIGVEIDDYYFSIVKDKLANNSKALI